MGAPKMGVLDEIEQHQVMTCVLAYGMIAPSVQRTINLFLLFWYTGQFILAKADTYLVRLLGMSRQEFDLLFLLAD
jgi:hypothetical protein